MRGIYKLHAAAQTAQARRDWLTICEMARATGVEPPAVDHEKLGWRALDRRSERLLAEIGRTWLDVDAAQKGESR